MEVEGLRLRTAGPTLTVTIAAEPENLFSGAMMDALVDAVVRADRNESLRFIRLRAEGDVFCMGRQSGGATPDDVRDMAQRIVNVNEALRTTPLTVVAEVNGSAAGFGAGLVGASDIAVAAEGATFAFPEVRAGFAPAAVIGWARFVLPSRLLYDMLSTGDPIDAAAARDAGLITEIVAREALAARVDERLRRLSGVDAFALREIKRLLVLTRTMDPGAAARASMDALAFGGLRALGRF
jgi:methylglutaconyl-CoA hydratase